MDIISWYKKIFNWVKEISHWTRFRSLGNSNLVKLSALVPFIGYLIIFNDYLTKQLKLDENILPNMNSAYYLYFGLFFLGLGSILYGLFCPNEIKHYGTSAAYVRGDGPAFHDSMFSKLEKEIKASNFIKDFEELRAELREAIKVQGKPETDEQKANHNKAILHLYFSALDEKYLIARICTGLFYLLGSLILGFSSILAFMRVAGSLFT